MSTPTREIPYSDDPIDANDRWWARSVRPVLDRLQREYGHLIPAMGTDQAPPPAPSVLIRQFDGPQPPASLEMLAGATEAVAAAGRRTA